MSAPGQEAAVRWGATVAVLACTGGLMYALGSTVGLWLACAVGLVVFAFPVGRLWDAHLDEVSNSRTRSDNQGKSPGRLIAETDSDDPTPVRSTRREPGPNSYYDEDDD